jgi:hypothetical protein
MVAIVLRHGIWLVDYSRDEDSNTPETRLPDAQPTQDQSDRYLGDGPKSVPASACSWEAYHYFVNHLDRYLSS